MTKKPFHKVAYKQTSNILRPLLKLECRIADNNYLFEALADTGCDTGFVLLKGQTKGMELGENRSDTPIRVCLADGHIVNAEVYIVTIKIGGKERIVELLVVDPRVIGEETVEEFCPLIGRQFLDNFDVLFHGREKKLSLFLS